MGMVSGGAKGSVSSISEAADWKGGLVYVHVLIRAKCGCSGDCTVAGVQECYGVWQHVGL